VLQCVASVLLVCGNAFQRAAVCNSVQQCAAVCCFKSENLAKEIGLSRSLSPSSVSKAYRMPHQDPQSCSVLQHIVACLIMLSARML